MFQELWYKGGNRVSQQRLAAHSFPAFPPHVPSFAAQPFPPGSFTEFKALFFRKPARCELGIRTPVERARRPRESGSGSPWRECAYPHDLENVRCAHWKESKKNVPGSNGAVTTLKTCSLLLSLCFPTHPPTHTLHTLLQRKKRRRRRNK